MRMTCFVHVPKTAGSSFVRTVHNEYGEKNAVNWDQSVAISGTAANLVSAHVPWHYMEPLMADRFTFTLMRDPVERVWSFARYKADKVGNNHHPPEEFLFDEGVASHRQMYNRYVTQLGGDFYIMKDLPGPPPMDQWLEQALENLAKLDAIYWIDDPLWQQKLWDDVKLDWTEEVRHNVSSFQDEMTPLQQERALELTQYDRMFYNEAEATFRGPLD